MQIIVAFAVAILATATSQILLKKGMIAYGQNISLANSLNLIKYAFSNYFLLAGIFSYVVSFFLWLVILSKVKLSVAYPITSINFVLVLIASYLCFGEKLSTAQYFGILFILFGVSILSLNK